MLKLFFLVSLLGLASCSKPDFRDVEGNGIYLDDLHEKWLIVNYWATWCGPCIAEIPELNELSKEHAGVNYDNPLPEEQAEQVKKMKIEFPVLTEEPATLLNIDIPVVLPTTFVFAPGGKLIKQLTGPQTKQTLLAVVEAAGVD